MALSPRPPSAIHRDVSARFELSRPYPSRYATTSPLSGVAVQRGASVVRIAGPVFTPAPTNPGGQFVAFEPVAWAAFACRIADGRVVRRDGPHEHACETLHDLGADTFAGLAGWLREAAPAGAILYSLAQTRDAFVSPDASAAGPRGFPFYRSTDGVAIERASRQALDGEVSGWLPIGGPYRDTPAQFAARVLSHLYAVEPLRH